MAETRERFLLAITAQVPADRIAEIHFFAPIKQGGYESGVAVVAAWPEGFVRDEPAVELVDIDEAVAEESAVEEQIADEEIVESSATEEPVGAESMSEESASDELVAEDPVDAMAATEEPSVEESPTVEESVAEESAPAQADAPVIRHVVYTARYRQTLKGVDRGKWETNVVAEADAPLVTIDAVVRGVLRRSGDVDEPTRMEGDEVRAFIEHRQAMQLTR